MPPWATVEKRGSGGWLPPGGPGSQPVRACIDTLERALGEVGDGCCWGLSDAELADLVGRAHQVDSAVAALRMRLVAEANRRDLGALAGVEAGARTPATSTAAWLAARQRVTRQAAGRQVRLAADLDTGHEQVRAALAAGRLNIEQAQVIVTALGRLPNTGRSTPRVVVEIGLLWLTSGLGAGTLSTGTRISAAQARRLACNSGLLPMVLGGDSVVLDLGREQRLFDHHQRIALARTQHGCIADGCDRPPAWCEAHHCTPWSEGGHTNLGEGVLLCGWHHHLVHDTGWTARIAPDGVPELLPPATVDPNRTPIRHRRFRRRAPA